MLFIVVFVLNSYHKLDSDGALHLLRMEPADGVPVDPLLHDTARAGHEAAHVDACHRQEGRSFLIFVNFNAKLVATKRCIENAYISGSFALSKRNVH